jgi:hypothetical protein
MCKLLLCLQTSTEPGIMEYQVGVQSNGPLAEEEFINTDMREFTLPPNLCNGSTYQFRVAAVDMCGRNGPFGQPVTMECCKCVCLDNGESIISNLLASKW